MCGRFTLTEPDVGVLLETFSLTHPPEPLPPRYNIAPTQAVATVVTENDGSRVLRLMRWGLIPSWAKDMAIGNRMINARAETVAEKPAFRRSFSTRRCLVLADGFYEWQRTDGKKGPSQPYYFQSKANPVFAFAGLWDMWTQPNGDSLNSCTIITTEANEVVRPVHERMPVILTQARWADWLQAQSTEDLLMMLRPLPPEQLDGIPVSPQVNNPAVDNPLCVQPWGGV